MANPEGLGVSPSRATDEPEGRTRRARPRHLFAYTQPSLFELAAAYGYGLAKNHPFIDGNKRTGFTVMATFLLVNGYLLEVAEGEVVQMMERLATDEETQESLAQWLEKNSGYQLD